MRRLSLPFLLVAVLSILPAPASAQMTCQVASTPLNRNPNPGNAEPLGDILLACASSAATGAAALRFDYPVPITNNTSTPNHPIEITTVSGGFANPKPTISVIGVGGNSGGGRIIVTIPALPAGMSGTFSVAGVLASLLNAPSAPLSVAIAVVPGSNVFIVAGQNRPVVRN